MSSAAYTTPIPPSPEHVENAVVADVRARFQRGLAKEGRIVGPGGTLEESARAEMRRQQPSHAGDDLRIGAGRLGQFQLACRWIEVQRFMEERRDAVPVAQTPSSVASQARASVQCRFTVAGEVPMASAVSSIESPPK